VTTTSIAFSDSDYHNDTLVLREGRRFTGGDVAAGAHVCNLTEQLAKKLFKEQPATGRSVQAGGTRCRVVGVYAELKGGLFNSAGGNEILFLPYTTFHQIAPGPIDAVLLYLTPGVRVDRASEGIDTVLRRLHGARAQYLTSDNQAQLQSFNTILGIIAIGLTAIGGVALIVAGIGIMNIMLVSVTERTREIGLRKSIGARRGDIALQFLLEAILLSFMGGGIGTLLGFLATVVAYSSVEALVGPAPIPYLLIMSVSVGFSTLVGCVFGTYPAIRAARMDPIEALRS
jgi:putative ABC transport system permease protein